MKTDLTRLLGIDIPIVQAPMEGAVGPLLASAVSNAGGLGTLAPWCQHEDSIRQQIRLTKSFTSKPFAVNLNLVSSQQHRLEVCLEEEVPVISLFWGDPGPLAQLAKEAGAIVMHTVGSASDACKAIECGVDIVVAQGWESGGHVKGEVATMPLIPAVVDAVGDVPVVAAGGIADGRGLAAALALGASGVWIGTRFLASEEATIHPDYQARVVAASEDSTVHLQDLYDGGWPDAPHRVIRNSTVSIWEQAGRPQTGERPGQNDIVAHDRSLGEIKRYRSYTPGAEAAGDIEALANWAGQSVAMVGSVKPASMIVQEIHQQAISILGRLNTETSC